MTGRIRQVVRSRACGFIRAENGDDVFFHASELHHTTIDALEDGAVVRFTLVPDPVSGPRAVRVRIDRCRASEPAAPRALDPRRRRTAGEQP